MFYLTVVPIQRLEVARNAGSLYYLLWVVEDLAANLSETKNEKENNSM
jgi:hypothetical protein